MRSSPWFHRRNTPSVCIISTEASRRTASRTSRSLLKRSCCSNSSSEAVFRLFSSISNKKLGRKSTRFFISDLAGKIGWFADLLIQRAKMRTQTAKTSVMNLWKDLSVFTRSPQLPCPHNPKPTSWTSACIHLSVLSSLIFQFPDVQATSQKCKHKP